MTTLLNFRQDKNAFFKSDRQSPLDNSQKQKFAGLNYFPENPSLEFDLALEKIDKPELITMATSTGNEQDYYKIGIVRFSVKGVEAVLQVYVSVNGGDYFIPFADKTAPAETYGAGRYLEPEDLGDGKLHIDFNMAYNPYCAYNDSWSCPIPPRENRIAVRIEAGEKKFHE